MNKKEFLDSLRYSLNKLPQDEVNAIIEDYNMHIDEQLEEGLSIEDILIKLGNPRDIAKEYLNELGYEEENKEKNNYEARRESEKVYEEPIMIKDKGTNNNNLVIFILLQFINFFVIAGFVFGIGIAVFSVGVTGIGLVGGSFGVLALNKSAEIIARIFKFFVLFGVGTLLFNGALAVGIVLTKVLIRYAKWNISFIS